MAAGTPLLALPLELREVIYKEVFSHSSQGLQLLTTCREIRTEASKFYFQKGVSFRSQSALCDWLENTPQQFLKHLQHVDEINLELQDADLTPILDTVTSSSSQTDLMPRLRYPEYYERKFDRLNRALRRLRNVNTFTLRALPSHQSAIYQEFLAKVLHMLVTIYPELQDLSLEGNLHHQSLNFLRPLRGLKAFSFDGFSASGPAETKEVFSDLELTSLSLVTQHTMLTPPTYQHSSSSSDPKSFTGDALRTLYQLASFSVTERSPTASSALFFTTEILGSLHSHKTLSNLSISLSYAPDGETLEALDEFLDKSSSIERLELDWPDLDPNELDTYVLLPSTLKSYRVRATSMAAAFDVLWSIVESRDKGGVSDLRRVVLMRDAWDTGPALRLPEAVDGLIDVERMDHDDDPDAEDSDEANVARAKKRLNALGVRVAWCTETS